MGGLGGRGGGEFYRGKSLKPHNMLHKSFSYLMYVIIYIGAALVLVPTYSIYDI